MALAAFNLRNPCLAATMCLFGKGELHNAWSRLLILSE